MTVCREAPADLQRNWQNISEMYVALGIRRSGETGPGLAPPSTYADAQSLSYMTGPSGGPRRTIDISIWNDAEARSCFYRWAGYDDNAVNANITRIRSEHPDNQAEADEAVQTYLNTLPALHRQIYNAAGMLNIFQQDYRLENGRNVGGGNRARPDSGESAAANLITDYEIQQYAAEALEDGDQNPAYEATGGRILSGIHAIIGMMTYLTTPPPAPVVLAPNNITAGSYFDVTAPTGGWRSGDRVFVDTTSVDGVPTNGSAAFRVQGSALPVGSHTVEIRRADGSIIRTPVTVAEDSGVVSRVFSWIGNHWQHLAGGAGALSALSLAYFLGRRSTPGNNPTPTPPRQDTAARTGGSNEGNAPKIEVNVTTSGDTRTESRSEGRTSNPPPAPQQGGAAPGNYNDVLNALGSEGAPNTDVLAALGDNAPATPLPGDAFNALLTETIDPVRYEAALRAVNPALADYFTQINSSGNPVTTFGDIATRMAITNPEALEAAQAAIRSGGLSGPRAVLELVTRGSGWSPAAADLADHPAAVARFEAAVRETRSGSGAESADARAERERREREAREGREHGEQRAVGR